MVTNTMELKASTEVSLIETGEKRDRLGRQITPAARRAERVTGWCESGLTQAESQGHPARRIPPYNRVKPDDAPKPFSKV